MKKIILVFTLIFSLFAISYGDFKTTSVEEQATNFYSWQKGFSWRLDSELKPFLGQNLADLVIPLTGQWEVDTSHLNTNEQLPWIHRGGLPVALFGDGASAPPLYCGTVYRFGLYAGPQALEMADANSQKNLRIIVYDSNNKSSQPLYEESIHIPLNTIKDDKNVGLAAAFATQWYEQYLDQAGGIVSIGSDVLRNKYGLESWLQYTGATSAWGAGDGSGIIISHLGKSDKFTYVVQLMSNATKKFQSFYAMNFSPALPENLSFLSQPLFMREPRPAGYWGVTAINNEHIRSNRQFSAILATLVDADHKKYGADEQELVGLFKANIDPREYELHRINTLYKKTASNTPVNYATLDQFVRERAEALTLASYVQNEIELVDSVDIPEKFEALTIHGGKINRSPLTTFLEGQGSPWEQCALLVYLLRQAGYAAAYVESKDHLLFAKNDFSRLLHLQLDKDYLVFAKNDISRLLRMDKALNYKGGYADTQDSSLVQVRYPWVVYYDESKKQWLHLFPWIKDTKVTEGYDLYGLMPENYKSGALWVRRYLENDPKILEHIKEGDNNDTVAVLFRRFIDKVAREKRISPEKIGVRYQNIKKSFSRWEDFPKPLNFEGEAVFSDSLITRNKLYSTVRLEISSIQNPAKKIITNELRLADIHNRALYIYFKPLSNSPNETRHQMILRMEGADGFTQNVAGAFNKPHLIGVQELGVALDGTDYQIKCESSMISRWMERSPILSCWLSIK
jgi:hypothetical protein